IILKAAITPVREEIVGGSVALLTWFNRLTPNIADKILAKYLIKAQLKNKLAFRRKDNLYKSTSEGRVITQNLDKAIHPSLYNRIVLLKPYFIKSAFLGALGLIALSLRRDK
ncbi:MAG: hypothetical protein K0R49_1202, partial [Burkholderiales bacterium]|nr:hypothetical protein [Burkholderiales bacterium]